MTQLDLFEPLQLELTARDEKKDEVKKRVENALKKFSEKTLDPKWIKKQRMKNEKFKNNHKN